MSRPVMIIIAIVCGIIGTIGIVTVNKPDTGETVYKDIVVAGKDLKPGSILDESTIAKKRMPEKYIDSLAIPWGERRNLYGQRLVIQALKGTQILWSNLESTLQKDFENRIPKGYRALSINVSRSTGVSGLLQPGSHVDIISMFAQTIEAGNITPTTKIKVLLQDITILAVGKLTTTLASNMTVSRMSGSSSYSTITVAVTLEEAETLIAAEARGKLYCVLRNPKEDPTPVEIREKSLNEALGDTVILRINTNRYEKRKKQPEKLP